MVNTRKKSYVGSGDESSQANECSDSSSASATKRTTRRSVSNAAAANAAPQTPKEVATPLRRSRRLSNSSVESLNDTPVPAKSLARRSIRGKNTESGDESSDLEVLVIKRRRGAGNKDTPALVPITEEKGNDPVVVSLEEGGEALQVETKEEKKEEVETISEIAEDVKPNIEEQNEKNEKSSSEKAKPEIVDLGSPPPVQVCREELSPEPSDGRTSANSDQSADSFKSIESPKNEANQTADNIHLVLETSFDEEEKQAESSEKKAPQSPAKSNAEREPASAFAEPASTDEKKPEEPEQMPVSSETVAENATENNVSSQEEKMDVEEAAETVNDGDASHETGSKKASNVVERLKKLAESKPAPKKTEKNNNAAEKSEPTVPDALEILRNIPRGKSKSGRTWKQPKSNPRYLYQDKGLKMGLEKVTQLRQERQRIKELEARMKEEKQARLAELKRRRELNKKREEENARRGEVVQVIRNTNKLKRMKKKQLKLIQKRDTTGM